MTTINMMDKAAPRGQLFPLLNWRSIRLPITSAFPPPKIFDTKKYPRHGINTMIQPEKIPLAVSGRITSKKVRQPLAPRSEEASNKV